MEDLFFLKEFTLITHHYFLFITIWLSPSLPLFINGYGYFFLLIHTYINIHIHGDIHSHRWTYVFIFSAYFRENLLWVDNVDVSYVYIWAEMFCSYIFMYWIWIQFPYRESRSGSNNDNSNNKKKDLCMT